MPTCREIVENDPMNTEEALRERLHEEFVKVRPDVFESVPAELDRLERAMASHLRCSLLMSADAFDAMQVASTDPVAIQKLIGVLPDT